METEFGITEENLREIIRQKRILLADLAKQIASLEKWLAVEPIEDVQEFLSRLKEIQALGIVEINRYIQQNRFKETVALPTPNFISQQSPSELWQKLRQYLGSAKNALINLRDALDGELPDLEEKLRNMEVDRLSLAYSKDSVEYGKAGVRWSKLNVVIAIGLTLLATFAFETFKPEITNLIRHLLGLASLSR